MRFSRTIVLLKDASQALLLQCHHTALRGFNRAFNAFLMQYQGFPEQKNRLWPIVASDVAWISFPYRQGTTPNLCSSCTTPGRGGGFLSGIKTVDLDRVSSTCSGCRHWYGR